MNNERERHLFVAWRRPDGLIVPVGRLTQYGTADQPSFQFVYLKVAERQDDFMALPGLPRLHQAYESSSLFPVFANRLMPRDRPDYPEFLEQLDLSAEADPFEVLERSEGVRVTDRVEVFPAPHRTDDGLLSTLFFARGIRHLERAAEAVAGVSAGDELTLEREPDNPVNEQAILMNTRTGQAVGWAPDYLLGLLYELRDLNGRWPTITAEHVNGLSTPAQMRLLCRLTSEWPTGYEPFSGPDFQPLATPHTMA